VSASCSLTPNTPTTRASRIGVSHQIGVDISHISQQSPSAPPMYQECVRPNARVVVGPRSLSIGARGVSRS